MYSPTLPPLNLHLISVSIAVSMKQLTLVPLTPTKLTCNCVLSVPKFSPVIVTSESKIGLALFGVNPSTFGAV